MSAQRSKIPNRLIAPRDQEIFGHTALRDLAVLSVVGYHAGLASGSEADPSWIAGYFQFSYLFVDLFFMLSGFIMVESYGARLYQPSALSDARKNITTFWKRRALKILPNYYVWLSIAIMVYLGHTHYFKPEELDQDCLGAAVALHMLLVQNLAGTCVAFNTPLWSIAVEIIAYVFFPLFLIGVRIWPALLVLSFLGYGWLMFEHGTFDLINGGASVVRCIVGFISGMSAVALMRYLPNQFLRTAQFPVLLGTALCVASGWEGAAIFLLFPLVLITGRNLGPVVALLRPWLLSVLGRASFTIYLAHVPILVVTLLLAHKIDAETGTRIGSDWRLFVPLNIAVSALFGVWAYKSIELNIEHRLSKR